jgi:hypothetical protein
MDDKIDLIFDQLCSKSTLKQSVSRSTHRVFQKIENKALEISNYLSSRILPIDEHVKVEFKSQSEFEFQVKFSGDLLAFIRHSNVVTLPEDHVVMKSPYIKANPQNGYFGHIMVYNFMADTIKYHRLNDPGYLLARILVNNDNHFYIEGVRQLDFKYPDISQNVITDELLKEFIESAMLTAIDNDLVSPTYQDIQMISYNFKLANQMVSQGEKIGFQMMGKSPV